MSSHGPLWLTSKSGLLRLWELHSFALDLVVQRDEVLVVEGTLSKDR